MSEPFDLPTHASHEEQLELLAQVLNYFEDLDRVQAGLPSLAPTERWQTLS